MDKRTEQTIYALLAQNGFEPKEGDLELFGDVLETYVNSLKGLHPIDLAGEEIAPTFNPATPKR